jgi:hypothetical protein
MSSGYDVIGGGSPSEQCAATSIGVQKDIHR